MLRPVAAALDAAHAQGVVHRDVKPANILLGKDGRVRLADLGIAFLRDGTRLTRPGVVLGTVPYMPPEQLERGEGSPAGDVYALGAVAFEALSGKKARRGRTPMEVALEARNGGPPDLATAWAGATPARRRCSSGRWHPRRPTGRGRPPSSWMSWRRRWGCQRPTA